MPGFCPHNQNDKQILDLEMTQAMKHLKNNSGFTLVEVLVAALIVGVGLIAYGLTSGNIIGQNTQSKKKTVAVTLAQERMESIRNTALTVSLTGANGLDSPTESGGSWTASAGGEVVDDEGATGTTDAIYTRTWTVTEDGTLTNFYTASVTVLWDGTETVTLDTLISQ
jgi:prepilin-type N-terminal cleavage/methylation domain-containing protein